MSFLFYIFSRITFLLLSSLHIVTGKRVPLLVGVNVIICDEKGNFLVQKRSDGQGFCFIGGVTRAGESLEKNIQREVKEETGLLLKDPKLLFIIDALKEFPFFLTVVFEGNVKGKKIKASWEGEIMWLPYDSFKGKMAFGSDRIVECFVLEQRPLKERKIS